MLSLSIVVPIYNESRTLPRLIEELSTLIGKFNFEVVFVNDGSTDNSLELIQTLTKSVLYRYVIVTKNNEGKTSAVKRGLASATGTHAIVLDADLELWISDIPLLWQVVESGTHDFVFGYRVFRSHSSFTWRYARGNQFLSNFYGLLFNVVLTDIMCGFKLLPIQHFREIPFSSRGFGLEIEIPLNIWKKKIRPYEVAVNYSPRTRMEGKTIGISDAFHMILLMASWRIRFALFKK